LPCLDESVSCSDGVEFVAVESGLDDHVSLFPLRLCAVDHTSLECPGWRGKSLLGGRIAQKRTVWVWRPRPVRRGRVPCRRRRSRRRLRVRRRCRAVRRSGWR
jgi:hypothetical protein